MYVKDFPFIAHLLYSSEIQFLLVKCFFGNQVLACPVITQSILTCLSIPMNYRFLYGTRGTLHKNFKSFNNVQLVFLSSYIQQVPGFIESPVNG